jgi:hypothetical protein
VKVRGPVKHATRAPCAGTGGSNLVNLAKELWNKTGLEPWSSVEQPS